MRPIFFLALALTACPPAPKPPNPNAGCPEACAQMRDLDCELGRVTPAGNSCETVCENAQRNGIDFATACLASAPSCEAADDC